jgi:hypothetical protein
MQRIYLGTIEAAPAVGNEIALKITANTGQQFEVRMDADRAKVFAEEIDKVRAGIVPPVAVAVAGEPVEQLPTVKKAPQAKAKGRPRKARSASVAA